MANSYPKGVLISFNGHTFISNRSLLQQGWGDTTTVEPAGIVASPNEIDLAGYSPLAIHSLFTWSYDVTCSGTNVAAVQDELDLLATLVRVVNGDGTTGQVGTLTVGRLGYPSNPATGTARLISVSSLEAYPTREKLALAFWVPNGFLVS